MSDTRPEELLRIQITGQSPELWQRFRGNFITAINKLLDTIVDHDKGGTLREESRKFQSALLDHARARLARAGLENERIEAEIRKMYAQMEKETAEARRTNAEADALEFKTSIAKLTFALGAAQAMLIGEKGEESIIIVRQIEALLSHVKSIEAIE